MSIEQYHTAQLNESTLHAAQQPESDLGVVLVPPGADVPDKKVLLSRLHLRAASGEWLTGARANLRAWEHTSNSGWTRIMGWPGIRLLTFLGYEVWLVWYQWKRARREATNCG
jgi:hypothetical protein